LPSNQKGNKMSQFEKRDFEPTYGHICPVCSTRLTTNRFGLREHILDEHTVMLIVKELLRLWEIVNK